MLISFLIILLLIVTSAFFAISELSLAASRKIKLQQLADEGDKRAEQVLALQKKPGLFFTVVQIGLNAVAILGGIIGDNAFSPALIPLFSQFMPLSTAVTVSFICSFLFVTSLFIVFADLIPKCIGMASPEKYALKTVRLMRFFLSSFVH